MADSSTIVAFATPPGRSALTVIRVSGMLSKKIAEQAFLQSKPVARHAYFGKYRASDGKILDECLWTFFENNLSYSGETMLEISCHGNPFISKKIYADLILRGCRPALPGEFTRRAFLNGKMDLTQAEAVSDIISANSERAMDAAQKLLNGAFGKKIADWNTSILNLLAETEAQIDFSEEEIPALDISQFALALDCLIRELQETRETARYSAMLREGINAVIFGVPNAGKSSLLNAIVGEDRALVSEEAGTTRDFISENITIGEFCIRIVDTAGIRDNTSSPLEEIGIARTIECMRNADFLIFVVALSEPLPDLSLNSEIKISPENTLIVFSKSDLPPKFDSSAYFSKFEHIALNLKNADAGSLLKEKISKVFRGKSILPDSDVLIVSARHAEALESAIEILSEAKAILGKIPIEFIAEKLRIAMEELSEILGRFDNEKVLDNVFSGFCIGK